MARRALRPPPGASEEPRCLGIPGAHSFHCALLAWGTGHLCQLSHCWRSPRGAFWGLQTSQSKAKEKTLWSLQSFASSPQRWRGAGKERPLQQRRGCRQAWTVAQGRPRPPHPESGQSCRSILYAPFSKWLLAKCSPRQLGFGRGKRGGHPVPSRSGATQSGNRGQALERETRRSGRWGGSRGAQGPRRRGVHIPPEGGIAPAGISEPALALGDPRARLLQVTPGIAW